MIHRIFTVYDKKAAAYLIPYYAKTIGMGERLFMDAVNAKDSDFSRHPGDYTLFELGFYDDETGKFEQTKDHPAEMLSAVQVLDQVGDTHA